MRTTNTPVVGRLMEEARAAKREHRHEMQVSLDDCRGLYEHVAANGYETPMLPTYDDYREMYGDNMLCCGVLLKPL